MTPVDQAEAQMEAPAPDDGSVESQDSFEQDMRAILLDRAGAGADTGAGAGAGAASEKESVLNFNQVPATSFHKDQDSKVSSIQKTARKAPEEAPKHPLSMMEEKLRQNEAVRISLAAETDYDDALGRVSPRVAAAASIVHPEPNTEADTVMQDKDSAALPPPQPAEDVLKISVGIEADRPTDMTSPNPPAPLQRSAAMHVRSRPGAFSMTPSSHRLVDTTGMQNQEADTSERTYTYDSGYSHTPSPTNSLTNRTSSGTAATSSRLLPEGLFPEARLVSNEEGNDVERQQASQLDPQHQEKRKQAILQQRQRLFHKAAALGLCVILLVVAVTLGLLLKPDKESNHQETADSTDMHQNSITEHPTVSGPGSVEDRLLSLLPHYTIQELDLLDSPQRLAWNWIMEEADLVEAYQYSDKRILQRYILATLFYATDGPVRWSNRDHWLDHESHECDWWARNSSGLFYYPEYNTELQWNVTGGPCGGPARDHNSSTPLFSVDHEFNDDTQYRHIWLWSNNLHGELPRELYLLTSLESISVDRNFLHGPFATHLGQLTNLQALGLYTNDFTGTLPTELGLLTDLEYLWAMSLAFEGSLPTQLVEMTSLKHLLVDGAMGEGPRLTGTIMTEMGLLTNLEWLWLQRNDLQGTIPSEMGLMSSLQIFSGTLPSELGLLSNSLELLALYDTSIEGHLPTQIGQLTTMHTFHLNGLSSLTGPLPTELGLLSNSLEKLYLWECGLSGTLPTELGLLGQNKSFHLALDGNLFSGTIPTELGNAHRMNLMHIAGNQLTGPIPSELGLLEYFDNSMVLYENSLTGRIPSELGNLDPWRLWISRNQLSGPIPSEIASLSRLEIMRLHDNLLSSSLPTELALMLNLTELTLSENNLTGVIPSEMGSLTALQKLHLHNNSLVGTLSPTLGSMTDLKELSVSNTTLDGVVPIELCDLSNWTTGLVLDCELVECACDSCHCGSSILLEPADNW